MPSSIAVLSSLPSSHAARRAPRGLENTTPSLFSPSKLKVRTPKNTWTRPDQRLPRRARRHIAFSQGQCATCGAQRLLKYAQRTICCRYACLRRLRRSGGRGMPMAVRTMRLRCVLLQDRGGAWHALLRSQSAHRNEAAQQAGCCQQGPMLDLPHARIVQRGPAYTGFLDMRLFELEAICENCLA